MASKALPFPRGKTLGDSLDNLTLSDTWYQWLEGKEFEVEDTIHGTGEKVILRVVKNDTGSAITIAKRFMRFNTAAEDFGRRIAGYVNAEGMYCVLPDDAYSVGATIPDDDMFYVVVKGPVSGTTAAGSVSLSAHDPVATTATGYIGGTKAQYGEFVAGIADVASTTASATLLLHVDSGVGGIVGT